MKNSRKYLKYFLICVCLYSAVMLCKTFYDYSVGDDIYQSAETEFTQVKAVPEEPTPSAPTIEEPEEAAPVEPALAVDFAELSKINPDIFGWLYIPDTSISYPLLAGVDNQKYLTTTYNNKKSSFGSIFIDMANSTDLNNQHTIIYGHNMRNGSMFGSLKKYNSQDYFENHKYTYILTPEGYLKYEIFAAAQTLTTDGVYIRNFNTEDEFEQFLSFLSAKPSYIQTNTKPTAKDKIITLSTCVTSGTSNKRFVIHGVLVEDTRNQADKTNESGPITPENTPVPGAPEKAPVLQ